MKRQERGADHPPPSNTEVKERVELYDIFCGEVYIIYFHLYDLHDFLEMEDCQ